MNEFCTGVVAAVAFMAVLNGMWGVAFIVSIMGLAFYFSPKEKSAKK